MDVNIDGVESVFVDIPMNAHAVQEGTESTLSNDIVGIEKRNGVIRDTDTPLFSSTPSLELVGEIDFGLEGKQLQRNLPRRCLKLSTKLLISYRGRYVEMTADLALPVIRGQAWKILS